jgi:hypothetical protein
MVEVLAAMTTDELVAQVKELDRLYQAAEAAKAAWMRTPNLITQMRCWDTSDAYDEAKARADAQMAAWEQAETEHSDVSR